MPRRRGLGRARLRASRTGVIGPSTSRAGSGRRLRERTRRATPPPARCGGLGWHRAVGLQPARAGPRTRRWPSRPWAACGAALGRAAGGVHRGRCPARTCRGTSSTCDGRAWSSRRRRRVAGRRSRRQASTRDAGRGRSTSCWAAPLAARRRSSRSGTSCSTAARRCAASSRRSRRSGRALGPEWRVQGLLVVRGTHRNRALVRDLRPLFAARYPASSQAWLRALSDPNTAMPAAGGFLWTSVTGDQLRAARL